MTKQELAEDLVQTMYVGFGTDTLREMVNLGKTLQVGEVPSDVAELFQAALERELARRDAAQ